MRRIIYFALLAVPGLTCSSALAQEPSLLDEITFDMHSAAVKLAKPSTDEPQDPQRQAIEKLDALIAKLEEECKNCRGRSSSANPSKPAADSVIKGGPGGMGKLHAAERNGRDWGQLPPHERDRIMQSLTEGFPPHYQNILERYYKRLAEEKPASQLNEDSARAKPAAAAADSSPAKSEQP